MIAHGSAYVTGDLDVCYRRTPANIGGLAAAMAPLHPHLRGAPADLLFCFDVPTIQAGLDFPLTTDYGDIDLFGDVSGLGAYEKVSAQSITMEILGLSVQVLSLDGLIAAKKAVARSHDKRHLLELEELKKILDASRTENP